MVYFTETMHLLYNIKKSLYAFFDKDVMSMKLERVNENQICCTLTKQDLESRQIRMSELAYGSKKAQGLFRDMIQQANYELGFEVDDMPLMVEAVPMSSGSIVLLITKVEYPDELDTRFSIFSEPDEDEYPEEFFEPEEPVKGAEDFELMVSAAPQDSGGEHRDVIKLFSFSRMEHLEQLARILSGYYAGTNAVYKNRRTGSYELELHKSGHSAKEFNKICNIASDYAQQISYMNSLRAFHREHEEILLKNNALERIASICRT